LGDFRNVIQNPQAIQHLLARRLQQNTGSNGFALGGLFKDPNIVSVLSEQVRDGGSRNSTSDDSYFHNCALDVV
jgi:hypothetical protein